ncbi:MAG TPA: hypothetical protein VGB55_06435, partial [Tepidisphaeraceae bacterium]
MAAELICYCGSGKLLRECHHRKQLLGNAVDAARPRVDAGASATQPAFDLNDLLKRMRDIANKKYCSVPPAMQVDCQGDIIRAHSVARGGALKQIARDSRVYTVMNDLMTLKKNNGVLVPELVVISKASTFTGFCATHDRDLFSPIENNPLQPTAHHAFLLAYRAVCRELFSKTFQKGANGLTLDIASKQDPMLNAMMRSLHVPMDEAIEVGLRDFKFWKDKYDAALISQDWSALRFYAIEFDHVPEV